MRKIFAPLILVAVALPVQAQYSQQNDQNILYGVKKNPMPQGVVVEQGTANSGIPTSGTQQADELRKNQPQRLRGGYGYGGGPNVIYRDRKDKGLTVITGPDGTTVCRDASGRVTVCY